MKLHPETKFDWLLFIMQVLTFQKPRLITSMMYWKWSKSVHNWWENLPGKRIILKSSKIPPAQNLVSPTPFSPNICHGLKKLRRVLQPLSLILKKKAEKKFWNSEKKTLTEVNVGCRTIFTLWNLCWNVRLLLPSFEDKSTAMTSEASEKPTALPAHTKKSTWWS